MFLDQCFCLYDSHITLNHLILGEKALFIVLLFYHMVQSRRHSEDWKLWIYLYGYLDLQLKLLYSSVTYHCSYYSGSCISEVWSEERFVCVPAPSQLWPIAAGSCVIFLKVVTVAALKFLQPAALASFCAAESELRCSLSAGQG